MPTYDPTEHEDVREERASKSKRYLISCDDVRATFKLVSVAQAEAEASVEVGACIASYVTYRCSQLCREHEAGERCRELDGLWLPGVHPMLSEFLPPHRVGCSCWVETSDPELGNRASSNRVVAFCADCGRRFRFGFREWGCVPCECGRGAPESEAWTE